MNYRILLVDDEMPSLRLIQNVITSHVPGFHVVNLCSSGEQAWSWLQTHTVDVLITDISMQQMNGIELAKLARKQQPGIHILIFSGYAEFEYAQGAIEAAVDGYMLKPLSISAIRQAMEKIRVSLDADWLAQAAQLLPKLAIGQPCPQESLNRYFPDCAWRFAFIRWGGLEMRMNQPPVSTSLILPGPDSCYALRGRDEEEQILIFRDQGLEQFLSGLSLIMTRRSAATWTVVYQPAVQSVTDLKQFLGDACRVLTQRAVIGKHQILSLTSPSKAAEKSVLTQTDLNQINYFFSSRGKGKTTALKNLLLDIAVRWEHASVTQQSAWQEVQRIVLSCVSANPDIGADYSRLMDSVAELFLYASSYGDLLINLYALLSGNDTSNRKLSPQELYDFAINYIDTHYSDPPTVQVVCDELGISQTYLSRLFRKYSDTTFNNYLLRRRMEEAMALLQKRPDMLLRDVAACVGYEDSSYFTKVFHNYTGKTPSQWTAENALQ